jgi:glucose-6-phosphate 1-epimerase
MNIKELQKRFEIPGLVSLTDGSGDLPMLWVDTQWSVAEIYLHGAQVATFQKKNEPALLFLSEESRFEEGQAIRGGVPVILPWFGARDGDMAHGFARVKDWELKATSAGKDGSAQVVLRLPDSPEMAKWPTPFAAEYAVTVGKTLKLELRIENLSKERELVLEECLHTYFEVGEIGSVSIAGLKGVEYLDKVGGSAKKTETNEVIRIASEVDRVYMDTTGDVEIRDAKLKRSIRVKKEGSQSTVVWNPWIEKAKAMADFGDEEYLKMVCVESGNVGRNKLTIAPGKNATMTVELVTEKIS